ncbi:MAG TPA: hypothetical protein VLV15_17600, partial [Dongiaceae bacterium]|nr:hypothetical protein [Dongiaceae bacterium]
GENGLLVPPGDPVAIADALERLADPSLRGRLVEQLSVDVTAYHPDRVAARVADAVRAELALAGAARSV